MTFARGVFAGIAMLLGVSALAAEPELPSMQDLVGTEDLELFRLSPSGRYLAYVRRRSGNNALEIRDLENPAKAKVATLGNWWPDRMVWVDDRRLAVQDRAILYSFGRNNMTFRRVLRGWDREDNRRFGDSEFGKQIDYWTLNSDVPDDDESVIITSTNLKGYTSVHRYNMFTGVMTDIIVGRKHKVDRWVSLDDGTPVIGLRESGDREIVLVPEPGSDDWIEHEKLHKNAPFTLGSAPTGPYQDLVSRWWYLDASGNMIFTEAASSGRRRVTQYDPREARVVDVLLEDERYDVGGGGTRMSLLGRDREIAGIFFAKHKSVVTAFNPELEAVVAAASEKATGRSIKPLTWTEDFEHTIIESGSGVQNTTWYHYRASDDRLTVIGDLSLDETEFQLSQMRYVTLPVADGPMLDGYLRLPPEAVGAPKGLIVAARWQINARANDGYDADLTYLTTRGYAVLEVNPRGVLGYGKQFYAEGARNGFETLTDDLRVSAQWAAAERGFGAEQTVLFGSGMGGAHALLAAARFPDSFQAVATYGAPTDFAAQYRAYAKDDNANGEAYLALAAVDPKKPRSSLKDLSPMAQASAIRQPVLLFHGDEDTRVDAKQADSLAKAIRKAGGRVRVERVADEGWLFRSSTKRRIMLEQILELFDANITIVEASEP
ncbi:MAG: prolyl oligopeptidase family serine peptidase [Pseudomonadota bacterium]